MSAAVLVIGAAACSTAPKLPDRVERPPESIIISALAQDAIDPLELDPNWLPLGHAIEGDTPPTTQPTPPTTEPNSGPTPSEAPPTTTPPTTVDSSSEPDSALARIRSNGIPSTGGPQVVLAGCYGGTSRAHWGYFNNGAAGGAVTEPGGIVVPLSAICINLAQPDVYSALVHEMGHKWFWETGQWASSSAAYGGREQAAECFAKIWGASYFGQGGCSDDIAARMQAQYGW